jgi:chromosome condensin MukBEF MukE localization factor
METYISSEDVMTNIKAYRKSLDYDDQFDFDMETKRMKLSDKRRDKLKNTVRASEHRMNRYGIHKDKK